MPESSNVTGVDSFVDFQTFSNTTAPTVSEFLDSVQSKKSPTGPTERTPKPEYLISSIATYLGCLGKVPFNFYHGFNGFCWSRTVAAVARLME